MSLNVKAPFSFGIKEIAELLRLRVRHQTQYSMDVDCPFCGREYKMNLNFQKNVFHCNRCGKGGGMLDLFCHVRGLPDRKTAYQLIQEELQGRPVTVNTTASGQICLAEVTQETVSLAPAEVCDKAYRKMLDGLSLSAAHLRALEERGLSVERIREIQFRTTPVHPSPNLTRWMLESGCQLEGVPGFYKNSNGQWAANFTRMAYGILIPVVSVNGLISGFQIRLDHPYNKRKYLWFTSVNKPSGTSSGSPPHFVGRPEDDVIYITEGSLKGYVANDLLGKSFGAVPGVSQYGSLRALLDMLRPYGKKTLCEAYDMDKFQNVYVEAARQEFFRIARDEYGFETYTVKWSSQYKGIDDWALAKRETQK